MFKKFDLSADDTPFMFSPELSGECQRLIHIKREDQCGRLHGFGGMSMRKLEFTLVEAALNKSTDAVLIGRYGSPYTRQFVLEASRAGVVCHCVFVDNYTHDHAQFLSDLHICGASTYGTCTPEFVNGLIHSLHQEDRRVYISHCEGSNPVAAMGGFALMDELHLDLTKRNITDPVNIYVGCSSGVTLAGMYSGLDSLRQRGQPVDHITLVGVPVYQTSDSVEETLSTARSLVVAAYNNLYEAAVSEGVDLPGNALCDEDVELQCAEESSALSFHSKIEFAKAFYRATGIILDVTYGLPVIRNMLADISAGDREGSYVFVNPVVSTTPYFNYTA